MTKKINHAKVNYKQRIVEHFSMIESLLSFFPFFIRYPLMFFLFLVQKSITNPLYLLAIFIIFMIIKRVVKTNTFYFEESQL